MAIKRRGLGRNLDALLGGAKSEGQTATTQVDVAAGQTTSPANGLQFVAIDLIKPGAFQPRKVFNDDALDELAKSIKEQGILSPLTVRKLKNINGHYELIAGERRWRAAQLAGLQEIPVLIKVLDDEDALAIALIENIQREDLNPIEEAAALKRLLDEFAMTHQEIADAVGKSRSAVSNLLRLMELHPDVKRLLECGDLEMGHARALLALDGGDDQIRAANTVVAKGLSVRETEKMVKQLLAPKLQEQAVKQAQTDVNIQNLVNRLTEKLAAKVNISHTQSGKGKIVIQYHSVAELEGILEHIE